MAHLRRFLLSPLVLGPLLATIIAFGLTVPTWQGELQAAGKGASLQSNLLSILHTELNHEHAGPGKAHVTGQHCHPACTMAVIPSSPGPVPGGHAFSTLPVAHDLTPVPKVPSGLDRPPKFS